MFKDFILSQIRNSKFYWKYRHLINKNIWNEYLENSKKTRTNFYHQFMQSKKLKSVFDFGCASGTNIFSIQENMNELVALGYDISKEAIKVGSKYLTQQDYGENHKIVLTNSLGISFIESFLEENKLNYFDLTISDRVFCFIDEIQFIRFIDTYHRFFNYVAIDEFHTNKSQKLGNLFFSRNYIEIFKQYNFKLIESSPSLHPIFKEDHITNAAKRMVFKRDHFV